MRTETFEWTGPAVGPRVPIASSGVAYLTGVRDGVFPPPAIGPLISAEILVMEPGRMQLLCSASDSQFGLLRELDPGTAQLVVNTAISCVAHGLVAEGQGWATVESRAGYLRPGTPRAGSLTATAEVIESSPGRALIRGELADEGGRVLTTVVATIAVFELGAAEVRPSAPRPRAASASRTAPGP
jgi:acyl-coenzyme A thioesterase PaaI-like protein